MADETTETPVTDSRFPGFNLEVERSHAETAAALAVSPPATTPSPSSPMPPRPPAVVLDELEHFIRGQYGSHFHFDELLAELKAGLQEAK